MKKIGFIGLGLMGVPMTSRLLDAGYHLVVSNRSPAAVKMLSSKGAKPASSPREVASQVDVVITMLPDAPDVETVALGKNGIVEGAHEGLIYVDMSTISPSVTRNVASSLAVKGVNMLDAPVSGGVVGAQNGSLSIMVGGDESTFNQCLDVFKAMGKIIVHQGAVGLGQTTKLCNQILVSINMQGICEALTLGLKAGLDLNKLLESISGGAAGSWALSNLAPRILKGDLEPGFKVSHQNKDLRHVLSLAYDMKISLPGASLAHQLFAALEADGKGDKGTQALISVYNKLSNTTV